VRRSLFAAWKRCASPGALAVLTLILAAVLRMARLGAIPSCLEYDEAANVILAGEIAHGDKLPVFIRAYTGKEVLYFYLAAGLMRLGGVSPFVLRLSSVFWGMLCVALTYAYTRELLVYAGQPERRRRWLTLLAMALVATSYWQTHLGRFGYRAISLPPMLALTATSLLRGLRIRQRGWIVLAGAAAGLSAYTYSSVRVFPVLLLLIWAWILVADRHAWRVRLAQLLLFGATATLVVAPLGLFFLQNPEAFSVRLDQVSILSPSVHRGDLHGTFLRTVRLALGMFTVAGDRNPLYNDPGRPVFGPALGACFYLGLLICAWQLFRPASRARSRFPSFFLLAWLVVMMVPNVLSASGVPHNLRAMALVPAVYIVAAAGLDAIIEAMEAVSRRLVIGLPAYALFPPLALLAVLGIESGLTYRGYVAWAASAPPYYKGNQALLRAAEVIDAHPEAVPYVATYFQQHATLAVASRRYRQVRWLSGDTLILPPTDEHALLIYDHTNPVDPLLRQRYLPPGEPFHRELGPDGEIGFEAFWIEPGQVATPIPQHHVGANMGHTLSFLGYDLNAPARAGGVLDVTLYVEVLRPVDHNDWAFFVHLVDDLGFRWGEDTFFEYPSAQWRPHEVVVLRRRIPIAAGAPPGAYALTFGAFSASLDTRLPVLSDAGQMMGTVASIGPIHVVRAETAPDARPAVQQLLDVVWPDGTILLGTDRDRSDLRPGETLALTLHWLAGSTPPQPSALRIWLTGPSGEYALLWEGDPVHGLYPFSAWQAGEYVRDRYALRLPLDLRVGDYDLRIALLDDANRSTVTSEGTEWVSLGTLHVHAIDRLWEPPSFAHPVGARLGSQVELLGYDLEPVRVRAGDALSLTLVWRCREPIEIAYTVFTHLLDAGSQVRGQKDNPPVRGTYPTTLWVPGEIVVDPYQIPVAADTAPGKYTIEVGLYDPRTMQRLPVYDPAGALGDRVLLARVEVVP